LTFLGGLFGVLYALMGLMGQGVRLLAPIALVILVLVVRPALTLAATTSLGADRITVRRPPFGRTAIPYSRVGLVETRRGLLLEWPVLYLRDGDLVELGAPVRFWFRPDPGFDRDLGVLRAAIDGSEIAGPYTRWSMSRLLAGPLLTATALALILIDPPWAGDAWPLRAHARRLPDACRLFEDRARRLLPGATVDRVFSRSDHSEAYVTRHSCEWDATRTAADGTTVIDIGRLSIVLELDRGIGRVSDSEEAHREFERQIRAGAGESEVKVPHTGDEAELIIEPGGPNYTWVTVVVRKANIEEKIDLIFKGQAREHEAALTAEDLARLGLSRVRFS
jgi:hypothetical protein